MKPIAAARQRSLFTLALLVGLSQSGHTQGFDCAKASTAAERAICSDKSLGDLDANLTALFKEGLAVARSREMRQSLTSDQRRWLKHRDATCVAPVESGCLVKLYADRIEYLWKWANDHSFASENITPPPEVARFVDSSETVAQLEAGDINGDGLPDYLLVVERADATTTLALLVRQADGSLKAAGKNSAIVQCHFCGGMGGGSSVKPTGDGFEVSEETGAGLVNSGVEFKFAYRPGEKTWVLIEERTWDNDGMETPPKHQERTVKPYEHGEVIPFEVVAYDPQGAF